MELIFNEHFDNETIGFNGFRFVNCTFTNCIIIITSLDFDFERCSFYGSALHVDPYLPVFEISHRLSQSTYDNDTTCSRDDYKHPRTVVDLPIAK